MIKFSLGGYEDTKSTSCGIVSNNGNIFVIDRQNDAIQVFDQNGKFLMKFGSSGSSNGQFTRPSAIAINSNENILVFDSLNYRVQIFDQNGNFLITFETLKDQNVKFMERFGLSFGYIRRYALQAIAIDANGNILLTDNNKVQMFNQNGKFLTMFGDQEDRSINPCGIAIDNSKNVFITDSYSHMVHVFDQNGKFLTSFGSKGSADGEFNCPAGIAIDNDENIMICDSQNQRICIYRRDF